MEQIKICEKYNLKLIEDVKEALGTKFTSGKYKNKYVATIDDFGVYFFYGNEIITTDGDRMIVAKN